MSKSLFFPLLCVVMLMSSCEELSQDEIDHSNFSLDFSSNAPVHFREELKVGVADVKDGYDYELTLPNGNVQGKPEYQTDKARFTDEGWYTITAYGSRNFVARDSLLVEVIPDSISCTPPTNKLTSNTSVSMDFYYVGGRETPSDNYEVTGNSSSGDLYIELGHADKPVEERTYLTRQKSSFMARDEVSVRMNLGGFGGSLYGQKGELVHLSVENGKSVLSLCDYTVSSAQYGDIEINARLVLD